jgi:hypothetical protein
MGNGFVIKYKQSKVGRRLVYSQSALLVLRPLPLLQHFFLFAN